MDLLVDCGVVYELNISETGLLSRFEFTKFPIKYKPLMAYYISGKYNIITTNCIYVFDGETLDTYAYDSEITPVVKLEFFDHVPYSTLWMYSGADLVFVYRPHPFNLDANECNPQIRKYLDLYTFVQSGLFDANIDEVYIADELCQYPTNGIFLSVLTCINITRRVICQYFYSNPKRAASERCYCVEKILHIDPRKIIFTNASHKPIIMFFNIPGYFK